jgi:hypothetical protein
LVEREHHVLDQLDLHTAEADHEKRSEDGVLGHSDDDLLARPILKIRAGKQYIMPNRTALRVMYLITTR